MSRERLIGSYLIRFTEHDDRPSTQVRDLRDGTTLEFETWIAAWEYLDTVLRASSTSAQEDPGPSPRPRR